MTYSPLLWKPKLGYFALVGASLPPGVLEDLPAAALRTRREPAKDLWLADGRLLLAYRLRPGHLRSGILTIPLGHRGHVAGRYSLHPAGSETKRTIQLTDSGAGWNFSSSFRGLGAEEGDVALLLIDTEARLLKLWVGGRELQAAWDAGRAEEVVRALEAAAPEADSDEPETADDD